MEEKNNKWKWEINKRGNNKWGKLHRSVVFMEQCKSTSKEKGGNGMLRMLKFFNYKSIEMLRKNRKKGRYERERTDKQFKMFLEVL